MTKLYDKSRWGLPGQPAHYAAMECGIGKDRALISAALWDYAHARRNQLGIYYQIGHPITAQYTEQHEWAEMTSLPIGERLTSRLGNLKVWIYAKVGTAGEGNSVDLRLSLGAYSEDLITINATSPAWYVAELEVPTISAGDLRLTIQHRTRGTNTIYLYGVSAYQLETAGSAAWTDLDGTYSMFAADDYPASALMYRLARDDISYMHREWSPRSNVINHWASDWYVTNTVGYDVIGRYKLRKRAGPTTVRILLSHSADAAGTVRIRTTFNSVQQTTDVSVSTTPGNTWLTDYKVAATAIESELIIEGQIIGGSTTEAYIFGRAVIEDVTSSPVVTLPDILDAGPRKAIKADPTMQNLASLLSTVRDIQSRNILMTDWCWGAAGNQEYYNYATTWNKSDLPYIVSATSMIARALAYISTGTKRLLCRLGYLSTAGSSYFKQIQFQLTDDLTDQEMYDAKGPIPGDRQYQFQGERMELHEIAGVLELGAAYGYYNDDAASGMRWVTAQAVTENAAEYVIPQYLMIHELTLEPEDM